jgi:hypothetical protein
MQVLPISPSVPWQEMTVDIDDPSATPATYIFEFKINSRDNTWYMNVTDINRLPIATGVRVVLGTYLGRRYQHILFRHGVLVAIDTAQLGKDAGIDDLGRRVIVARFTTQEILRGRGLYG